MRAGFPSSYDPPSDWKPVRRLLFLFMSKNRGRLVQLAVNVSLWKLQVAHNFPLIQLLLLTKKFLKCDWLRRVVFQPYLKYLHVENTVAVATKTAYLYCFVAVTKVDNFPEFEGTNTYSYDQTGLKAKDTIRIFLATTPDNSTSKVLRRSE